MHRDDSVPKAIEEDWRCWRSELSHLSTKAVTSPRKRLFIRSNFMASVMLPRMSSLLAG